MDYFNQMAVYLTQRYIKREVNKMVSTMGLEKFKNPPLSILIAVLEENQFLANCLTETSNNLPDNCQVEMALPPGPLGTAYNRKFCLIIRRLQKFVELGASVDYILLEFSRDVKSERGMETWKVLQVSDGGSPLRQCTSI